MIKHLSNVDDKKVIDSFILIMKTTFGKSIVNLMAILNQYQVATPLTAIGHVMIVD